MLQTTADFFLEALCLLLYTHTEDVKKLVKELIAVYNDDKESPEFQDPKIVIYVALLRDLLEGDIGTMTPAEISAFKMKAMQNPVLTADAELMERIRPIFANEASISARRIQTLMKRVSMFVILHRSNKTIRKMYAAGRNAEDANDLEKQSTAISSILEYARDITRMYDTVTTQDYSAVDMVDFSSMDSVRNAVLQHQKSVCSDLIWKLGWQGVTRAFTRWRGGIRRGTFGAVIACSGHFKSGMMLNLCRWFCMLNKPIVKPGTIPTIVFISLENELGYNIMEWYKQIYVNTYRRLPPEDATVEDIVKFVQEKLAVNGFKLLVYRELGEEFGLEKYKSRLNKLISEGHDIQACFVDYIGLMKVDVSSQENAAKARQVLAGHIANYGKHMGITTITGWQMTGEADALGGTGNTNVVKQYKNSHLADSKGFARELDWQMFLHCERNHVDIPFLTGRLFKLRYTEGARDMRQEYWAYRFHPEMGILDDIDGIDKSIPDLYAVADDGMHATDALFAA